MANLVSRPRFGRGSRLFSASAASYFYAPLVDPVNVVPPLTLACRVMFLTLPTPTGNAAYLTSFSFPSGNHDVLLFLEYPTGGPFAGSYVFRLSVRAATSTSDRGVQPGGLHTITTGEWYSVVGVFRDSLNLEVWTAVADYKGAFFQGGPGTVIGTPASFVPSLQRFEVGGTYYNGLLYNGVGSWLTADVAWWSRALTQNETNAFLAGTNPVRISDGASSEARNALRAYYPLTQGGYVEQPFDTARSVPLRAIGNPVSLDYRYPPVETPPRSRRVFPVMPPAPSVPSERRMGTFIQVTP